MEGVWDMDLGVIIPVVQKEYAKALAKQISKNTRVPDKIIIINNTGDPGFCLDFGDITSRVEVFVPVKPMRVNPSWRYGISRLKDMEIISILNDDLIINPYFFAKIDEVFSLKIDRYVGVVPSDCLEPACMIEKGVHVKDENKLEPLGRRQGWAMSLLKSFMDMVGPIPESLGTFCGDDWYYWTAKYHNKMWMRMVDNLVYHYGSSSVKPMGFEKMFLKSEKNQFIKEMEAYIDKREEEKKCKSV